LQQAFDIYAGIDHGLTDNTMMFYTGDVKQFIRFMGPDVPLEDVILGDYLEWLEELRVGESAAGRKYWALKHFLGFFGYTPLDDYKDGYKSSWTTHPMPSGTLYDLLTRNPEDYDQARSRLMTLLAWDRLFPRDQYWLVLNDINIKMGLVRTQRGIFALSPQTKHALGVWLDTRRQHGTEPSLLTGKKGSRIGYVPIMIALGQWIKLATNYKHGAKTIIAARYLDDYNRLTIKKYAASQLTRQWYRPLDFVIHVLKFFREEGYINANG
jgi:hypothetical protein